MVSLNSLWLDLFYFSSLLDPNKTYEFSNYIFTCTSRLFTSSYYMSFFVCLLFLFSSLYWIGQVLLLLYMNIQKIVYIYFTCWIDVHTISFILAATLKYKIQNSES